MLLTRFRLHKGCCASPFVQYQLWGGVCVRFISGEAILRCGNASYSLLQWRAVSGHALAADKWQQRFFEL